MPTWLARQRALATATALSKANACHEHDARLLRCCSRSSWRPGLLGLRYRHGARVTLVVTATPLPRGLSAELLAGDSAIGFGTNRGSTFRKGEAGESPCTSCNRRSDDRALGFLLPCRTASTMAALQAKSSNRRGCPQGRSLGPRQRDSRGDMRAARLEPRQRPRPATILARPGHCGAVGIVQVAVA